MLEGAEKREPSYTVGGKISCNDFHTCLGASVIAQLVKNPPAMPDTPLQLWVGKVPWRRDGLPTPVFLGFPGGLVGKESACNERDLGLIPA